AFSLPAGDSKQSSLDLAIAAADEGFRLRGGSNKLCGRSAHPAGDAGRSQCTKAKYGEEGDAGFRHALDADIIHTHIGDITEAILMIQELDSDLLAGEGRETISHIYITCGRDAIVHDRCEDSARCIGDVRVLPVEDNSIGRKPLPPKVQYRARWQNSRQVAVNTRITGAFRRGKVP